MIRYSASALVLIPPHGTLSFTIRQCFPVSKGIIEPGFSDRERREADSAVLTQLLDKYTIDAQKDPQDTAAIEALHRGCDLMLQFHAEPPEYLDIGWNDGCRFVAIPATVLDRIAALCVELKWMSTFQMAIAFMVKP